MSDTWNDIQAIKNRQNTLRAKMMERRRLREDIAAGLSNTGGAPSIVPTIVQTPIAEQPVIPGMSKILVKTTPNTTVIPATHQHMTDTAVRVATDPEVEKKLLMVLCDISLDIPSDSKVITEHTSRLMEREVDVLLVEELLRKFATQKLISIKFTEGMDVLIVYSLDLTKLSASAMTKVQSKKRKYESEDEEEEEVGNKQMKTVPGPETGDIEPAVYAIDQRKRRKKLNEEIQALLVTQTAKEQLLVEKFKSRGGPQLQEFCQYGTREECHRTGPEGANCKRLHFKKIIRKHTDESLGDCSFLNTCFHMDTCKDSSNMAANVVSTTYQQIQSGQVQQSPVPAWYYDYDNNCSIDSLYTVHRQGPYPPNSGTNSSIMNPSLVSSGLYSSAPIPDTSHIHGRSFSSVPAPQRIDQSRPYLDNNPNTGNIPIDPNRPSNLNVPREMVARQFPTLSHLNTTADSHPSGIMPALHQSVGSRDTRNIPERPYHPLTGTDTTVPPPSLLSEMPSTSAFPYSSIPYSLTAPPPAPSASAVTSPPYTQVGDMQSFDLAGPVISYCWSVTDDLLQNTRSTTEVKSPPKLVKPKNVSNSGKNESVVQKCGRKT